MSEKYQYVKNIFSEVLDREPLPDNIKINKFYTVSDYIKAVYEHIHKEYYGELTKDAISFLGISHTELNGLLIEIICSNLYCDVSLISQIIASKGKRHEYFLSELGVFGSENKKTIERHRQRLTPNRLTGRKCKIVLPNQENYAYYIPTLAEVFRETLFVKRNDIFDISEVFFDVFKALFYDADEQVKDDRQTTDIGLIKSYRLWEFTTDTLMQVSNTYQEVMTGTSNYKYAELNLIEKLFGLITLSSIIEQDFTKTELRLVADGLSKLHSLGYCNMTELIVGKVRKNNIEAFRDFIEEYIYPLCSKCITIILSELITYIGRLETEKRSKYVDTFLKVCQNHITYRVSDAKIRNMVDTKSELMLELFKVLHHLPEQDDKEAIREYLISSYMDYSDERTIIDKNGKLTLIADVSYKDLSYLRESKDVDFYEDTSDDEIKKYFRGK